MEVWTIIFWLIVGGVIGHIEGYHQGYMRGKLDCERRLLPELTRAMERLGDIDEFDELEKQWKKEDREWRQRIRKTNKHQ